LIIIGPYKVKGEIKRRGMKKGYKPEMEKGGLR
jgi:hypothetical protein